MKSAEPSLILTNTKEDPKEGQKIAVSGIYLNRIFDEIFLAGIILIQSCWRKWSKDSCDATDLILIKTIYQALFEENWDIAERLGLYSKDCQVDSDRNRLYLDINYCQSLKWQNKQDELNKELEKFDVSSLRPIYLVAYYALKSDIKNFYRHITDAIIIDNMELDCFLDWPLFRDFRKDPNYRKTIASHFKSAKRKKATITFDADKPTLLPSTVPQV